MKKIYCFFWLFIILFSCTTDIDGYSRLDNGLRYKIVESDTNMPKAKIGDVLVIDLVYKNKNGEILFSSHALERTYLRKLTEPAHPGGSIEDALAMMHVGDSAIFKINAANFLRFSEEYANIPDDLDLNENYIFYVRLKEIMQHESFDSHLVAKYHEDEKIELELLDKYIKRANITVEPEISGIYYVEHEKGTGELIKRGDIVEIFYTGKFIAGNVFDTNYGKNPLQFSAGLGHVIRGLDIGIQLMRKGGKAMIIIPSRLAYGESGSIGILPYSTLIFEVEVVKVY